MMEFPLGIFYNFLFLNVLKIHLKIKNDGIPAGDILQFFIFKCVLKTHLKIKNDGIPVRDILQFLIIGFICQH
uniref:Uncharacterized protein n=1 Tax=viral metagenome TaxID=1070528 RepID=A0A6C0EAM3_9ZZZZ